VALQAVTLNPARFLGFEDRVGSLEVGQGRHLPDHHRLAAGVRHRDRTGVHPGPQDRHGRLRASPLLREVLDKMRTVASGEVHLAPNAASLLLKQYKNGGAAADPLSILSERERDVLMLTVEGYSSREIGGKLFISPKTVDTYRARIMDKLKFKHRSELVRFALQTGLLHAD
jgi:DNA-binding CsgD family transcriptional regulator